MEIFHSGRAVAVDGRGEDFSLGDRKEDSGKSLGKTEKKIIPFLPPPPAVVPKRERERKEHWIKKLAPLTFWIDPKIRPFAEWNSENIFRVMNFFPRFCCPFSFRLLIFFSRLEPSQNKINLSFESIVLKSDVLIKSGTFIYFSAHFMFL